MCYCKGIKVYSCQMQCDRILVTLHHIASHEVFIDAGHDNMMFKRIAYIIICYYDTLINKICP